MNDKNKKSGAVHLTDDNFKDTVLKAKMPVFVDFYAEWCGPCQMAAPIIDDIASDEKYKGKIIIAKVNVDDCPETAGEYKVRSIPVFIVVKAKKDGGIEVVSSNMGFPGEDGIRKIIEEAIK